MVIMENYGKFGNSGTDEEFVGRGRGCVYAVYDDERGGRRVF